VRARDLAERQLKDMHARFKPDQLGEVRASAIACSNMKVQRGRESFQFRDLKFPVATTGSPAGDIPVLLINNHKVDSVADAQAYIARLRDTDRVMTEVAATMRRAGGGASSPTRSTSRLRETDALKVITGAPFDSGADSTLLADFSKEGRGAERARGRQGEAAGRCERRADRPVPAAATPLIAAIDEIEPKSKGNFGAWTCRTARPITPTG
jgi:uncharacterized protein (DUF885 family)